MNPVSGEHHERAVKAIDPNGSAYGLSPWGLDQLIERYFASLAEQGVRLVDLREVVEWLRNDAPPVGYPPLLAEPLERHFGSVSDGD